VQTLAAVGQMITGSRGTEDLGGPLGIGKIAGDAAALGFASLVSFMAILSVNLALINLFPIPMLDGGHLMFYAAEAIRGRPLPPKAQEIGFRAGFALLERPDQFRGVPLGGRAVRVKRPQGRLDESRLQGAVATP
jgi:regulator of sigma E protease